jgi:hypothetical protein
MPHLGIGFKINRRKAVDRQFRLPKKMPHLDGAMNLTGPRGLCFHRAAGLVLDLPPATLAVGTFPAATSEQQQENPEFSSVDFLHAWVEVKDWVLAPTLIERAQAEGTHWIFLKRDYYAANCPRDIAHLSRGKLKKLSTEYGLGKHLIHFTPLKHGAKFGDIILDAVGIKFVVTSRGGVLPAPRDR